MEFLDLKNISERYLELVNPTSPEKILTVGKVLGLKEDSRVIDFGCGFGEVLALWGQHYGISGVGIDIRPYACERARHKLSVRGMAERFEIICGSGSEYRFEPHAFDVAACIGATFIWGGFGQTIRAMKDAVHKRGKLAIGEAHWLTDQVPPTYANREHLLTEFELLQIARKEGFNLEYVVRASHDDWDHYESSNWYGLIRWIEENPDHLERQQVIDYLHESQEEYLRYARQYFGWAIYILNPI